MNRNLTTRSLVFAAAVLAIAACRKTPETASAPPPPAAPDAASARAASGDRARRYRRLKCKSAPSSRPRRWAR